MSPCRNHKGVGERDLTAGDAGDSCNTMVLSTRVLVPVVLEYRCTRVRTRVRSVVLLCTVVFFGLSLIRTRVLEYRVPLVARGAANGLLHTRRARNSQHQLSLPAAAACVPNCAETPTTTALRAPRRAVATSFFCFPQSSLPIAGLQGVVWSEPSVRSCRSSGRTRQLLCVPAGEGRQAGPPAKPSPS